MSSDRPHENDPLAPHRGRLLGLAYRMLGSRSHADDVVQDAYIRFAGAQDVHNPEAFLVTVVTRLCLDRLSPLERAAFLLHDVFDVPFSEIARMLDRTEAACRQLATRARRAVRDTRPAPAATPDSHARLLSAFSEAVASGDVSRLAGLLRADAVAVTDGGGRKTAALNPIMGADKVARFFIALAAKTAGHDVRIQPTMINGTVGALLYMDGEVDHTLSMAIDGDRIAAIYIVRNPDKLRHAPGCEHH